MALLEELKLYIKREYGGYQAAEDATGFPDLAEYLYGWKAVTIPVLERLIHTFPAAFQSLRTFHGSALAGFKYYLERLDMIVEPKRPSPAIKKVRAWFPAIIERAENKKIILEPVAQGGEVLAQFFRELALGKDPERLGRTAQIYKRLGEVEAQWPQVEARFKRRRPGGVPIHSENMDVLACHLLMCCNLKTRLKEFYEAAEYLRFLFQIPLPERSPVRGYALVNLMMLLRAVDKSTDAVHAGRRIFAELMQGTDDLQSYFLLTHGSALFDNQSNEAAISTFQLCFKVAPKSVWSGYAARNVVQTLAQRMGQYQQALDIATEVDIWRTMPDIHFRMQRVVGSTYRLLGELDLAREAYWAAYSEGHAAGRITGEWQIGLFCDMLRANEPLDTLFEELDRMSLSKAERTSPKLCNALEEFEQLVAARTEAGAEIPSQKSLGQIRSALLGSVSH